MKILLELKELAEDREDIKLEIAKGKSNEKLIKAERYKLRELRINEPYNPRYYEEKEVYLRNLEAKKAYLNLLN